MGGKGKGEGGKGKGEIRDGIADFLGGTQIQVDVSGKSTDVAADRRQGTVNDEVPKTKGK